MSQIETLYVAEKPDVARSLAAAMAPLSVLNKGKEIADGCIMLSNGVAITWFLGHLIEMAPVAAYIPEGHRESKDYFKFLPIAPEKFIFYPRSERSVRGEVQMRAGKPVPMKQYTNVIRLLKSAKRIVNAGDIDREGQLIADEMFEQAGMDPCSPKIDRLVTSSWKSEDVRRAMDVLEKNSDDKWVWRRQAAEIRREADFELGMSLSMACQQLLGDRRTAVGRIKTPIVAMVKKRNDIIENFKPVHYFTPIVILTDGTEMRWDSRPGSAGRPGFDAQGRIISEELAKKIAQRIGQGLPGQVTSATRDHKKEPPPLPFSMGTLQVAVGQQFGLSLKEIEKAAQALYEKHKMISYVGTDCQFLPESSHADARKILSGLGHVFPQIASGANIGLKSRAFNDKKIDEHFAIMPTGVVSDAIDSNQRNVFGAISKRYMAQFYPDHEYYSSKLEAVFGEGSQADIFKATAKEVIRMGWKEIEADAESTGTVVSSSDDEDQEKNRQSSGQKN